MLTNFDQHDLQCDVYAISSVENKFLFDNSVSLVDHKLLFDNMLSSVESKLLFDNNVIFSRKQVIIW